MEFLIGHYIPQVHIAILGILVLIKWTTLVHHISCEVPLIRLLMLRASGTHCHSWPLALDKSIPLDQGSVWIWTPWTSGTPICHSWPIVYPYTHNISCLTITLHESLGPCAHPYVTIANAQKPKTMHIIALMESLDLNLIRRFLCLYY